MRSDLTETLIRSKLARYLDGKLSLRAFCKWFVPRTWDVHEWGTPELRELAYGIELRLAEYSSGHWTEVDFRKKLAPFATSLRKVRIDPAAEYRFVPRPDRETATFFHATASWAGVDYLESASSTRYEAEFV